MICSDTAHKWNCSHQIFSQVHASPYMTIFSKLLREFHNEEWHVVIAVVIVPLSISSTVLRDTVFRFFVSTIAAFIGLSVCPVRISTFVGAPVLVESFPVVIRPLPSKSPFSSEIGTSKPSI